MAELIRNSGSEARLGLVTNGDEWMLVHAPPAETTGYASWFANLWHEEPLTQRAFRTLLSAERFFGVPEDETLEALLTRSGQDQQEVTDQLGYQVRRAVEVLIQSLDKADRDDKGELLAGLDEARLYEAALTVMMRLVFLFCAEERGLLLLGDDLYDGNYAVSTLRQQLQEAADQHGEEILGLRYDAWARLLTTFRAVYGGVQHQDFKLPAYGGHLFDPDRFPFLEGRQSGTSWKETPAQPLPVTNQTVLHLLRSLQLLEVKIPGRGGGIETQKLSFRALGIAQIGHVYEGLLDHTAVRATEPVLGLAGGRDKEPEIPLLKLEELLAKGEDQLADVLRKETGRTPAALANALSAELDDELRNRFRTVCQGDDELWQRVKPLAPLVRVDTFGYPVVIPAGSVYVTAGTDRRSSGTHYTPRSLTEPIVQYTLEPLVYASPAAGTPKDQWKLKGPKQLLDLKICDMACGSGAFLVQACRYLSERLLEAWEAVEQESPGAVKITPLGEPSTGEADEQLIPDDPDERLVYAHRIIAQRCLYGVDRNPLACEMAKLSLWLLTLAKDKPFTFLDHAIRTGDSLVGISSLDQLLRFSLDDEISTGPLLQQQRKQIQKRLDAVKLLRKQIEELPSNTPADIERKAAMLKNADEQTRRLTYAADMLLAESWPPMTDAEREEALNSTLVEAEYKFKDLPVDRLDIEATNRLDAAGISNRFHWPLEFPEVFAFDGFDAIIGNPPFLGKKRIVHAYGDNYRTFIKKTIVVKKGAGDLCLHFYHRALTLVQDSSYTGFVATSSVGEGDNLRCGPQHLLERGASFFRTLPQIAWPGSADLDIAIIHFVRGEWNGKRFVNGQEVDHIGALLTDDPTNLTVYQLCSRRGQAAKGVTPFGAGFVLSPEEAQTMISQESRNSAVIKPYIVGSDFSRNVGQQPIRFMIDFGDMNEQEASTYRLPFERVQKLVKPQRDKLHRQIHEPCYWRHWDRRAALFSALPSGSVLLTSLISKHWSLAFVPPGYVYDQKVIVFAENTYQTFALLQSIVHESWARRAGELNLGPTPSYTVSANFNTFPTPSEVQLSLRKSTFEATTKSLAIVGESLHEDRRCIMERRQQGLTDTYNHFHTSDETAADIQKLRDLHVKMDRTVATAYGWDDVELGHGFHETKQGVRFTISEPARREVVQRLLKLNHQRYAEEVEQGLHDKKLRKLKKSSKRESDEVTHRRNSLFD